ncbi:uncharacterized protein E5676_scaffold284G00880 [Cucumis melo var. makuwa]|uniref:Uncharacterized protein n=1 Tax=Cucumis melo var. makuwa TaxID=1194695 RepID=A0A5D3DBU4_CUCMM|nr:uncharacterized protein E5676_scaffold284G00880 [Cucumis melo var. makuwa]
MSVDLLQQPFFNRKEADQLNNRLWIEADEPLAPSGYGQPYVCGLEINQTYRRAVFENNGITILVCEHCKKQWNTKDQCWKLHSRSLRGNKHSSNEQQNLGCTDVKEIASPSQPTGPTACQTNFLTQSAITQSVKSPVSCTVKLLSYFNLFALGLEFGEDDWHCPT